MEKGEKGGLKGVKKLETSHNDTGKVEFFGYYGKPSGSSSNG